MWIAAIGLMMALAALAWRYAGARAPHRAVAALLTLDLLTSVVRQGLALLNAPAYEAAHGAPLVGAARLNFHLDEALYLTGPAGLAAVAAVVFLEESARKRAVRVVVGTWILVSAVLAASYPVIRRDLLARVYLVVELVTIATVGAAWWSAWRRRVMPSLVEGSVMVLAATKFGAALYWSPFARGWDWQMIANMTGYSALLVLHCGEVWGLRSSQSS